MEGYGGMFVNVSELVKKAYERYLIEDKKKESQSGKGN
jgi:hypothetical protein